MMYVDCLDNIYFMTVWLGASLDRVYIYTSYYIDYLIKFDIRTSCDDILDHLSHHGHIVYSKCACMQVYTVYTMYMHLYVCTVYCFTARSPHDHAYIICAVCLQ